MDKQSFINGYDYAVILLDEIINRGVITQVNAAVLKECVESMKKTSNSSAFGFLTSTSGSSAKEAPGARGLSGVFSAATKHFASKFLNR